MLDGRPPPITSSERDLTRKERSSIAQLRSGYCRLLGSYRSRIKKDASLNICADCGTTPHDVKHLFVFPAHPTTMIPSNLWNRQTDAVRELIYIGSRDPDWNEHGLKGEQPQHRVSGRNNILKALTGTSWRQHKETYKAAGETDHQLCCSCWSGNVRDTNHRNIQYTQNEALRISTGYHKMKMTHVDHLHVEAKIVKVREHSELL